MASSFIACSPRTPRGNGIFVIINLVTHGSFVVCLFLLELPSCPFAFDIVVLLDRLYLESSIDGYASW